MKIQLYTIINLVIMCAYAHAQQADGERLYADGNYAAAYPAFEKAASAGGADAMIRLGELDLLGLGREKNAEMAIGWYKQAIENGSAEAAFLVGELYNRGEHVVTAYQEAALYYEIAVERGFRKAGLPLGRLYTTSAAGKVQMQKAVDNLKFAALDQARGEHVKEAAYFLSQIYNGDSVVTDKKEAFKWTEIAAENGHRDAASIAGFQYFNGGLVEKNAEKAYRYSRAAAIAGHAGSQFNVGIMHYQGTGTRANPVTALAWFMVARNTDPATDNGTIAQFKAAMSTSQVSTAEKEADMLLNRVGR